METQTQETAHNKLTVYGELRALDFDREKCTEIMQQMKSDEKDFRIDDGNAEYRFIHTDEIDSIQKEELLSDLYVLGNFTPWFIADITGLDMDTIEKAQKSESFELLGALMAKNIDEVQENYSRTDGYGHHFAIYDGQENEAGNYYVFRTN